MSIQQRTLGYVSGIQRLVWPQGTNVPVTAYLWGGGGGGGGNDSGRGGVGEGGGATEVNFLVSAGDVIDVAVGGPGLPGQSSRSQAGGGAAGASSVTSVIFGTRTATAINGPVIPSTNSSYVAFLNTYGVWVNPVSATNFDRSYTVNFPITALYTFTGSADNSAEVYVNDVFVGAIPGYRGSWAFSFFVTAGNATVRIVAVNTGGPGSVALTIGSGVSYSGSHGGQAGPSGSSGGGGGGGGATVIFKNGAALAVAAGGGGGAGAGNVGTRNGDNAPGSSGQAAIGDSAGQNGQNHPGDGGGGGGGGGGLGGGNGGLVRSGDQGGLAGTGGLSSSPFSNPSGRFAGGRDNVFYPGNAGTGGLGTAAGSAGAAALLFDTPGLYVHSETSFEPVKDLWININNKWTLVETTYVKDNGVWEPLLGSVAPVFDVIADGFGQSPRPAAATASAPVYTPPTFNSSEGSEGGWGTPNNPGPTANQCGPGDSPGGAKIICTKLHELELMSEEIYLADQAFGAELIRTNPDIYNGYRAWAEIVVDWMNGGGPKMMPWMSDEDFNVAIKKWSTVWAQDIATPWAEEMAFKMGKKETGSLTGRMITAAGIPICKAVGVWQRAFGPSKKPAGFGKGLMLIPIFVMFKLVAELGRAIETYRN
jgi:hypothetical protein